MCGRESGDQEGWEILRGEEKKERRGERKCVWEKAGVRGKVGRMRERERG